MIKFLIDDTINDIKDISGIIKIKKLYCFSFALAPLSVTTVSPKSSNALLCVEHLMTFTRNTIRIQMTHWVWPKSPGNGKCSLVETDSAVTAGSWWHHMRQCFTSMWSSSLARASSSLYSSESSRTPYIILCLTNLWCDKLFTYQFFFF